MSVPIVKYLYECMCGGIIKFELYIKTFALSNPQKIKNILKTKHIRLEIEEKKGSSDRSYFFSLHLSSMTLYILGLLQPKHFYFFSACVVLFILFYYV